jgi:hypothetical protein
MELRIFKTILKGYLIFGVDVLKRDAKVIFL